MSNQSKAPGRHDVPWCVIAYSTEYHIHTMRLPESLAELAIKKGWRVLIRDSEMPVGPHDIEPEQRNANRSGDTGNE